MSALAAPALLAPTTPPPVGSGWKPWRLTIPQYRKLGETGWLNGVKTMLIHGEVYTMVFPNPPHDVALSLTDRWLNRVFATGYYVRNQMGFDIGTNNDPGPDLAVVPGDIRDYAAATPRVAVLIVEVADTSLDMDTTTKAELYATAGVPDYWVIDLVNRQIIVFRDPAPLPSGLGATAYQNRHTFGPTDSVSPLHAPTASVRVADLLP
jgi:Uma2 family endonuclease